MSVFRRHCRICGNDVLDVNASQPDPLGTRDADGRLPVTVYRAEPCGHESRHGDLDGLVIEWESVELDDRQVISLVERLRRRCVLAIAPAELFDVAAIAALCDWIDDDAMPMVQS